MKKIFYLFTMILAFSSCAPRDTFFDRKFLKLEKLHSVSEIAELHDDIKDKAMLNTEFSTTESFDTLKLMNGEVIVGDVRRIKYTNKPTEDRSRIYKVNVKTDSGKLIQKIKAEEVRSVGYDEMVLVSKKKMAVAPSDLSEKEFHEKNIWANNFLYAGLALVISSLGIISAGSLAFAIDQDWTGLYLFIYGLGIGSGLFLISLPFLLAGLLKRRALRFFIRRTY
jgi:hypothetical protein